MQITANPLIDLIVQVFRNEVFKIIVHSYDPLRKEIIELFISHLKQ